MSNVNEFGSGHDDYLNIAWSASAKPNRYYVVANLGGTQTGIGEFIIPNSPFAGSIPVFVKAKGPFTVAGSGAAMNAVGNIGLFSQASPGADIEYDALTTTILGVAGSPIASLEDNLGPGRRGA